ncbi:MAG: ArsC/Spx/MgsR family protein [Candidatus Didemnitutus sp.]|nr:ArsC/Spx/MgsR family protein [Candidatus Didemnitutus sp.]
MTRPPVTIYTYAGCSTCRQAIKWLRAKEIALVEKPIRETPPSLGELRRMLACQNGNLRRLFNTSGLDYRALGLSTTLPYMKEEDALRLLTGNGNLVKRPFLLGPSFGLVGFDAAAWGAVLDQQPSDPR